ncbi:MAG: ABC transporter permease [Thermoanaerobaculaceae bacterium]
MVALLILARRNLRRRPWRSLLTAGGVGLAFATFLVIVATVRSLEDECVSSVAALETEITVQQAGVATPYSSRLTPAQLQALQTLPQVRRVSPVAVGITRLPQSSFFMVFGANPRDALVRDLHLVAGRCFAEGERELMIGYAASRRLGIGVGDRVEIMRRVQARVVGVYESGRGLLDGSCIVELGTTQAAFQLGEAVNLAFLKLADGAPVAEAITAIGQRLPELEASPSELWVSTYRQLEIVRRYASYLALVALLAAVLALANTLNMNTLERVEEIGILRAVGWGRSKIAGLVLTEGLILSLVGGLGGLPASLLMLRLLGSGSAAVPLQPTLLDRGTLLQGSLLLAAVGLVGSLPALAAALRLRPWAALRHG